MPLERNDVDHPLRRKKVDGSLLRLSVTPIPGWVARMWSITSLFPDKGARRNPASQVTLHFEGRTYSGAVTWYCRKREGIAYRLFFDDELRYALAETFVMSNMRHLEARLRAAEGLQDDVEAEIPFWEFLDIEFDGPARRFDLTAYYLQKPSFPSLFRRMAAAAPLARIRDELAGKAVGRIHKQRWRPRSEFESEIGATNVIYMLLDTRNRLLYVGESGNLVTRLKRGHELIPEWDYFRYDLLPSELEPYRVQIERMLIRDMDGLFGHSSIGLPVTVSDFRLVNLKVDR
ncbi:GIY-YIG nuclease family protein [Azospirillum sp. SYSU D00513]|uniref:GIY-YIG nuclease family protein n=1 Tax=Azospirillum sp. SYSU D00513 TaxID=2812561 RepID=UPI001A967E82|nr:GIY-YIG nuclease family protein [Azospirillum sp. SYSU D00513]